MGDTFTETETTRICNVICANKKKDGHSFDCGLDFIRDIQKQKEKTNMGM